jgi:regulatory protein
MTAQSEGDQRERAYELGLRFLATRPRSVAEVRRRLKRGGYPPEVADGVLERLQSAGWLDDSEFARYWVNQRVEFRPRGPRALRAELHQHGVRSEVADVAIAQCVDDQQDGAYRAGLARARALSSADDLAFRRTLSAHLLRRGFDYAAVREAVRQLCETRRLAG